MGLIPFEWIPTGGHIPKYGRPRGVRISSKGPSVVLRSGNTQTGGVRRLRGHPCRRKKKHLTETDMKKVKDLIMPTVSFRVYVGPYLANANAPVGLNGFLGPNDNISLGLPKSDKYEGLIFMKSWFACPNSQIKQMVDNAASQLALTHSTYANHSNAVGVGPNTECGTAFLDNSAYAHDLSGSTINAVSSWVSAKVDSQITVHRFYNPEIAPVRLKVIYFETVLDNTINPFYLWSKDLQMMVPVGSANNAYANRVGVNDANRGMNPFINFQNIYADEIKGGTSIRFGDQNNNGGGAMAAGSGGLSAGKDYHQQCALLCNSQGTMLSPGGPHFRKFFKVTRQMVYTIKAGETMTMEHCNPSFQYTTVDRYMPNGQYTDESTASLPPEYRPKWGRGMIFMVQGASVFDVNNLTALGQIGAGGAGAEGAIGNLECSTSPCQLIHTFSMSCKVTAPAPQQKGMKFYIGNMPSSSAWADGDQGGTTHLNWDGVVNLTSTSNAAGIINQQVLGTEKVTQGL